MPGIDAFTSLCLHMDGADASTSFPDASASGHTVTANGNVQVDTAQSRFGGASALFDGSGDKLTIPDHASLRFGTGDFVVDFWIRFASVSGLQIIYNMEDPGGNPAPRIYLSGSVLIYDPTDSGVGVNSATTLLVDTWYHVALLRSSGTTYLFLDGVSQGTPAADTENYSANDGVTIGTQQGSTSFGVNGWIDEFRISKGTDRGWSGGFTPPVAAYSADARPRTFAAIIG